MRQIIVRGLLGGVFEWCKRVKTHPLRICLRQVFCDVELEIEHLRENKVIEVMVVDGQIETVHMQQDGD